MRSPHSGRPRETGVTTMTREQLLARLLMIRAQWRDRAMRKRIRDAAKAGEGPQRPGRSQNSP